MKLPSLLLSPFSLLLVSCAVLRAAESRPNIVYILADDLGYADLGSYGSTEVSTPRIDSIGQRGVRFTAGYVTAPQCSPSRVGLLTGSYQQRFGHETNLTMRAALDHGARLIPEHLKPAGYATALFGKWHLGETDPAHHPSKHGFDTVYDAKSFDARATAEPRLRNQICFERAAAYVAEPRTQPFFLYVAPMSPHVPQVYAPRYDAVFAAAKGSPTRRACIAMMAELDDGVGLILDALRAARLEESTLVVFLSDNGGQPPQNGSLNHPLRGKKGDVYEGGIRVPFLLQWPGTIPAGQVFAHPVSSLDLLPTALAVARTMPLPGITPDGVDLLPHLTGKISAAPHAQLFWRWTFHGHAKRAVRAGDWKWVKDGDAPAELYRLTADLSEATNLAAGEPAKLAELGAAYESWVAPLPPIAPLDNPRAAKKAKQPPR
jgi:arylsulfatase A-like enzyme